MLIMIQGAAALKSTGVHVIALLFAVAVCLTACEKTHFEWTEDVQLSDGSMVTTERSIRYANVNHELGGPTSADTELETISIFDGDARAPIWSYQLEPIVLDRDSTAKHLVVVANLLGVVLSREGDCMLWQQFGRPPTTQVAFELTTGRWQQVEIPVFMIGKRTNLLIGVPEDAHVSHVTLSQKLNWNDLRARYDRREVGAQEAIAQGRNMTARCAPYNKPSK
jgi:hypothetical protein